MKSEFLQRIRSKLAGTRDKMRSAAQPHVAAFHNAYEQEFPDTQGMSGQDKLRHGLQPTNRQGARRAVAEGARASGNMAISRGHELLDTIRRRINRQTPPSAT